MSLRLEEGISNVRLAVGPLRLKRGRYAVSIAMLNRSNNLHLYFGETAYEPSTSRAR